MSTQISIHAAVSHWLSTVIIGLNLCPFARGPYTDGLVHIEVSSACTFDSALDDVLTHIDALMQMSPSERSTTLLVTPDYFQDFGDFLEAIDTINAILEKTGADQFLQLAHFHPEYVFEGVAPDDASHYTNRSPYPIFHLLRTEEVADAVASMPDIDGLPARNIALMREMGIPALLKLGR